ncbi:MAG TPA: hypothetical protein VK483_14535 [Chitinophagaceae bacterium]|nr:hypothetical protein [Chitinophagaceae bacterium]
MLFSSNINIKHLKLTALFLLSPLFFFAQSLTGLWTGALSNDSATIRKDQSFEIALTEYRGKVYGYSRSEFIVNDTLYYIVKRVKGTIDGDVCEVTDDDIISYNFRGKLDKGVKVTSIFRRNEADSTWYLDGTWKTNATRKYYAVTGKVGLQEEKDLNASKLFPHLEELNLANDVAFYKDRKEGPPIVKVAHPEKIKTEYNDRPQPLVINNDIAIVPAKPNLQKAEPGPVPVLANETIDDIAKVESQAEPRADKNPVADLPKTDIKNIPSASVSVIPMQVTKTIAETKKPELIVAPEKTTTSVGTVTEKNEIKSEPIAKTAEKQEQSIVKNQPSSIKQASAIVNNPDTKTVAVVNNPAPEKKESRPDIPVGQVKSQPIAKTVVSQEKPVVKTQSAPTKQPDAIVKKTDTKSVAINNPVPEKKEPETVAKPIIPEVKKPAADVTAKAAVIEGRKSEFTQVVNFKADSLELSLYDNGEIDGDTVSVFMNGEVLMSRQGLKASAIKKTIYITPDNEDFTLVLFADNLGKYPPNTGLLVVHDGDDVYNLRFSSDFQKSSGIVFKRKK